MALNTIHITAIPKHIFPSKPLSRLLHPTSYSTSSLGCLKVILHLIRQSTSTPSPPAPQTLISIDGNSTLPHAQAKNPASSLQTVFLWDSTPNPLLSACDSWRPEATRSQVTCPRFLSWHVTAEIQIQFPSALNRCQTVNNSPSASL